MIATLGDASPILDVLILAHVLVGLLGYGSVAVSGLYARKVRREGVSAEVKRYFDGKRNRAQLFVYLVPVLGIIVGVVASPPKPWGYLWFQVAVGLWIVSAGVVGGMVSRGERQLAQDLSEGRDSMFGSARALERGVGICAVAYTTAFYLMLFKPNL